MIEKERDFFDTIVLAGMYTTKKSLSFHMRNLFKNIDLKDKKLLDIGGGSGLHSFYAACKGAREVVCLEPADAGSSSNIVQKFSNISQLLNIDNVTLKTSTFQDLAVQDDEYDIILLHNSINHLDETACIDLLTKEQAKLTYQEIFSKLYCIAKKDATLIICDCSRYNFFHFIGMKNPVASSIEWHKHQAPHVWSNLLTEAGFSSPKVKWSSFDRLGNLGKIFLGNRLAAYFLMSHFKLIMKKF